MSTDNQWLIRDNIGKQGATGNTTSGFTNIYRTGNTISGSFNIQGIKHPFLNTNFNIEEANAIFIIYNDLEYFNTRDPQATPILPYFGSAASVNPSSSLNHNFQSMDLMQNPKIIKHLYLTNIYEDDDLPSSVNVNDGNSAGSGTSYIFKTQQSNKIISSNHSVAPGKDITIIISHKLISNLGLNNSQYFFEYNKITPVLNSPLQIFNLQRISNEPIAGIISSGNCSVVGNNNDKIEFDINSGNYTYINLRATGITNLIIPPYPDPAAHPKFSDYYSHEAVFEISGNNTGPITPSLKEPIRLCN